MYNKYVHLYMRTWVCNEQPFLAATKLRKFSEMANICAGEAISSQPRTYKEEVKPPKNAFGEQTGHEVRVFANFGKPTSSNN